MSHAAVGSARFRLSLIALSIALAHTGGARADAAAQREQDAAPVLKTVKVAASAPLETTTEGSRSYTSPAMATATPFALSIRDTPQSVTIITRERIEDQGLTTITDVVNSATGVSAKAFDSSRSGFSARGFDITNLQIDGIPNTWSGGWSAGETLTDTTIYDRVEIVRGATGLLTGAGNPSAAINLVRKHADSRVFKGSVSLGAGSWNRRQGTVDLSLSLTADGNVRARVVGSYQEGDSFVDLLHNRKQVAYGVLEADLSADTLLRVGVSRQDNQPHGTQWGGLTPWYADGSHTDWSRSKTNGARWTTWASTVTTYFADLEQQFANDWKLRAVINHSSNDGDMRLLWLSGYPDRATGQGMSASPAWYATTRRQNDIGLHLSGPFELLGRGHELAFGVMHSEQKLRAHARDAINAAQPGPFNTWDGSYPEPAWGASYDYEDTKTRQTGTYAVARLSLADPLRLIIGGRISNWSIEGSSFWTDPYRFSHNQVVTPYAGLLYDIDSTYTLYVSYTDIFNPQNYRDRNGKYLDPLTGKNYEAGIKGEYFDGRLNAGLTVFHIKQDNVAQVDTGHLVPGTLDPAYYAASDTTSNGFELDISGELTENWSLSAGYSQFRAEDGDDVAINTNHPRKTFKLFSKYRLPGAWNRLSVGGGVNWESANYTDVINPQGGGERLRQPAFSLVNLMARYEFTPQLSGQINLNNVFDKKYYSQIGFYQQYAYGDPRNLMASVKYQF